MNAFKEGMLISAIVGLAVILLIIGVWYGEQRYKAKVENAFKVLKEDNGDDHPVARCMAEHWESLR